MCLPVCEKWDLIWWAIVGRGSLLLCRLVELWHVEYLSASRHSYALLGSKWVQGSVKITDLSKQGRNIQGLRYFPDKWDCWEKFVVIFDGVAVFFGWESLCLTVCECLVELQGHHNNNNNNNKFVICGEWFLWGKKHFGRCIYGRQFSKLYKPGLVRNIKATLP